MVNFVDSIILWEKLFFNMLPYLIHYKIFPYYFAIMFQKLRVYGFIQNLEIVSFNFTNMRMVDEFLLRYV